MASRKLRPAAGANNPVMPTSTFTFLASWRGQLLVCTVTLVLGAIYLVVRRPISVYWRHRQEALSRARQAELELMEKEDSISAQKAKKDGAHEAAGSAKDKKKRKGVGGVGSGGSHLKVNVPGVDGALGGSSRESSPAPSAALLLPPKSRHGHGPATTRQRSVSPSSTSASASGSVSPLPSPKPQIRVRQPTDEKVGRLPTITSSGESANTSTSAVSVSYSTPGASFGRGQNGIASSSTSMSNRTGESKSDTGRSKSSFPTPSRSNDASSLPTETRPEYIALPPSPPLSDSEPYRRNSNGGNVSDSTTNSCMPPSSSRPRPFSDGFSIMPDASYLPPPIPSYGKKKKRRDKQQQQQQQHEQGQQRLDPLFDVSSRTGSQMSDGVSRYSLPTSASTCADNHNDSASRSRSPTLLPETPTTRGARHIRNASLKAVRPGPNATPAEIDAILDERDQIIDRLRAEVGLAKVQEQQAVQLGDRARRELEVVRQAADEANTQHQALETEIIEHYDELHEIASEYDEMYHANERLFRDNGLQLGVRPMPQYIDFSARTPESAAPTDYGMVPLDMPNRGPPCCPAHHSYPNGHSQFNGYERGPGPMPFHPQQGPQFDDHFLNPNYTPYANGPGFGPGPFNMPHTPQGSRSTSSGSGSEHSLAPPPPHAHFEHPIPGPFQPSPPPPNQYPPHHPGGPNGMPPPGFQGPPNGMPPPGFQGPPNGMPPPGFQGPPNGMPPPGLQGPSNGMPPPGLQGPPNGMPHHPGPNQPPPPYPHAHSPSPMQHPHGGPMSPMPPQQFQHGGPMSPLPHQQFPHHGPNSPMPAPPMMMGSPHPMPPGPMGMPFPHGPMFPQGPMHGPMPFSEGPMPMPHGPMPFQQGPMQMLQGPGPMGHMPHGPMSGHNSPYGPPTPGPMMFPSPGPGPVYENGWMHLQPKSHMHMGPPPARRVSQNRANDVFAGPLSPGVLPPSGNSNGNRRPSPTNIGPRKLGLGLPSAFSFQSPVNGNSNSGTGTGSGSYSSPDSNVVPLALDGEQLRAAIAASVLKAKPDHPLSAASPAAPAVPEDQAQEVQSCTEALQGLGLGLDTTCDTANAEPITIKIDSIDQVEGELNGTGNTNGSAPAVPTAAPAPVAEAPKDAIKRADSEVSVAYSHSAPSSPDHSSRNSSSMYLNKRVFAEHEQDAADGNAPIAHERCIKKLAGSASDGMLRSKSQEHALAEEARQAWRAQVAADAAAAAAKQEQDPTDTTDADQNQDAQPDMFYYPSLSFTAEENEAQRQLFAKRREANAARIKAAADAKNKDKNKDKKKEKADTAGEATTAPDGADDAKAATDTETETEVAGEAKSETPVKTFSVVE